MIRPVAAVNVALCLFLVLSVGSLSAQTPPSPELAPLPLNPTPTLNARIYTTQPVGLYQYESSREGLSGVQSLGLRVEQRGGLVPFSMPYESFARFALGPKKQWGYPAGMPDVTPVRQRAFELYGGFRPRLEREKTTSVFKAMSRRYDMVTATTLNAPVYRSLMAAGPFQQARAEGAKSGPMLTTGDITEPEELPIPLRERLHKGLVPAHDRALADGWARFREGQYRQAARAFDNAALMDPADLEPRVGEVYCYVLSDSLRSARFVLADLDRLAPNIFALDFDLREKFPAVLPAQQLRITAQVAADRVDYPADIRGLYVFVLWYLGHQDDAVRSAVSLARSFPGSSYASWPEKMREAKSTLSSQSDSN